MARSWDRRLPDLPLENVGVRAGSLDEAWQHVSAEFLVRSVLVASDGPAESPPFAFEAARCTVRELLDALAAAFGLHWTQDERTGVTWLHPAALAYDQLLTVGIVVRNDHPGLPMQSGVLEPLAESEGNGLVAKEWGTVFGNTFNYAVDVPAGRHAVRDVLNACCVANPTKSFIGRVRPGHLFVSAVNLGSSERRRSPAPGALLLWDADVGLPRVGGAPAPREVVEALAHPTPAVRHAARNYLESVIWSAEVEEWARLAASPEQALWTCIGFVSVLVRSDEATYREAIEVMNRVATDEFLARCDPGLALVAALELARLTRDDRALAVVRGRSVGADELAEVTSDACRVLALSSFAREGLRSLVEAPGGLPPAVAAAARSASPGRLEFEPAGGYPDT